MELFHTWDTAKALSHLVVLMVAYALALPIGWNREKEERSAGLRTFPLVAMAACGFVLIAREVLMGDTTAQSHLMAGLMTGIGFIGGGAILKQGDRARGTATAASLWATGAIGAAVGYGHLDIAVILALITVLSLSLLSPIVRGVHEREDLDRDEV